MFVEEPSEAICTRHEVAITVNLSHVNLAKTYEAFEDPKAVYIIMELVEGGDMIKYIQETDYSSAFNNGWFQESVRRSNLLGSSLLRTTCSDPRLFLLTFRLGGASSL